MRSALITGVAAFGLSDEYDLDHEEHNRSADGSDTFNAEIAERR